MIRVLLVDDHQIVLDGLKSILEKNTEMEVLGCLADSREALILTGHLVPDVVIMDISMRGLNGIEATRRIKAEVPQVQVLCVSMHSDPEFVGAMLRAGASGYLLKEDTGDMLVDAIKTVIQGRNFLSPGISNSIIEFFRDGFQESVSPFQVLSNREREVLQLIAEGQSTRDISGVLHISERTVGSHREKIKLKLGISSIAGLTRYALQHGLTQLD